LRKSGCANAKCPLYYMKQGWWNPHQRGKAAKGRDWSPNEWMTFRAQVLRAQQKLIENAGTPYAKLKRTNIL